MTVTIRLIEAFPLLPPLREKLPHLAEHAARLGMNPDKPQPYRVFATRDLGRRLVASREDVDKSQPVIIDAEGAEVMTAGFADELLNAWPRAELINANEDIRESWNMAKERQ